LVVELGNHSKDFSEDKNRTRVPEVKASGGKDKARWG